MKITLRPSTEADLEWLDPFYESLMRPYVELTHEWTEFSHGETCSQGHIQIIQCGDKNIGMLKIIEREDCLYVGDIQLKAEHQGKGIGTKLMQQVIDQANALKTPIKLRVLKGNPAINLYERLGFKKDEPANKELDHCYQKVREFTPSP